jgi:hypothetical protein
MRTKPPPQSKARRKSSGRKADPKQFERFVETAKKIGVDESPEALDRAFEKVVRPKSWELYT